MANLTRRGYADPWRDFFDLDVFGNRSGSAQRSQLPAVNICEDEKSYQVEVVAPGFKKDAFKINMDDDLLTISAEQKAENNEGGDGKQYSRREYSYSSFTRSFQLPENTQAEAINARYEDGVLKITIPKAEEKPKASKQISIQ
ncbi:MAG TPA: Hsp20/alpha crystallin family protein [Flavisolibacter sp.]